MVNRMKKSADKRINQLNGEKTVMKIEETETQFFNKGNEINKLLTTLIGNKRVHLSILGLNGRHH